MGSAGVNGTHDRALSSGPGVVLGRSGASYGQAHYVERDYWPHNTALHVTDFHGNLPRYIFYLLSSIDFAQYNSGGAQQSLNRNFIASMAVTLPDHDEQVRIAAALDDAANLVRAIDALIVKKQAIKRGLMQQLLAGRTRLPGFSGRWATMTFDAIAAPSRDRVMPQRMNPATLLVELEHVESASGRLGRAATAESASSLKATFKAGDVLFGKLRSYLRKYWLADRDGLCSTEFWVLRASRGFASEYVRYLVASDRFVEATSGGYGTHMPRADWRVVRNLEFTVPARDEQQAIAAVLTDSDREIDLLAERLRKAQAVKQGMMQQLLTGKIRLPVTDFVA